ncbi:rhamnose-binding lectin-like, partial [Saccoglossus kowalevskii]
FAATTPSLPDEDEDLMDFEPAVEVEGAPECYDEMPAENRCGIKPKGLSIRLECEKGQYVYIQSASYGRSQGDVGCDVLTPLEADECTSETTLQAVKDKCEGRRSCVVPFRPNFYGGNPCGRRVETFLNVKYVCVKSCGGEPEALPAFAATTPSLPDEDEDLMDFEPAVEVEGAPECYDEMPAENRCGIKPKGLSIRLECEKGQYVYIQSASYGRSQGDVGCDVLTPLEADECTSETTLQAVKDKCEGRRSCVVPFRPNFHGGNPCGRRVETFLNVKYVCAKSCGGEPEALPAFAATTPSLQDEDEDLMNFEPAVEVEGAPECYDEMPAENRCGIKPKGLSIRLECEKGQYVYIQSASYGRSKGDVGCDVLTPLEADECTSVTTLQAVKDKCEGRRFCVVPFRPNFHGGNPCGRRVETFLNVKYVCVKSSFAATTPSLQDEDEDLMNFEPAVEVEGAPECYDEMPAENRCGIKPKGLSIRLECEKGH